MRNRGWRRLAFLVLFLGVVLFPLRPTAALAAAPAAECAPFDDDGNPTPQSECACSNDPADATYCMNATDYWILGISNTAKEGLISMLENLGRIYWLVIRVVSGLAVYLMDGAIWTSLREGVFDMLRTLLSGQGGLLAQIILGTNGLLVLAIMLAALLLIFPFFGELRLVKIDRVLVWAVVLGALFISSTQGFDLIEWVETTRGDIMQLVAGAEEGQADTLLEMVAAPMHATTAEVLQLDEAELLILPAAFEEAYFPGFEESDYKQIRVLAGSLGSGGVEFLDLSFTGRYLETDPRDVMAENQQAAFSGMWRIVIGLFSGYVLAMFAVLFMLLSLSSLILIVFLLACLPLGFFDFGASILGNVARRYTGILALSIFAGIAVRLMALIGGQALEDLNNNNLIAFAGGLAIAAGFLAYGIKAGVKTLDGALNTVAVSVSTVAGAATSGGGGGLVTGALQTGQKALGTAVTAAAAFGAGAMTGGLGAGLVGAAGAAMSGSKTGWTAGQMAAEAAPDSRVAQTFAAATRGFGTTGTVGNIVSTNRRINQTPALTALKKAEAAQFEQGDEKRAGQNLEHAFGNRRLGQEVQGVYREEGQAGAKRIRSLAETGQQAFFEMQAAGEKPLTASGSPTPALRAAMRTRFVEAGLVGPDDREGLRQAERLAIATMRRPMDWHLLPGKEGPRLMAEATMGQEAARAALPGSDSSAQMALWNLSARQGWGEKELTALFEAVQAGIIAGLTGANLAGSVSGALAGTPEFASLSHREREEAARLAVLAAEGAQVQLGVPLPADLDLEEAPEPPARKSPARAAPVAPADPTPQGRNGARPVVRGQPQPADAPEAASLPTVAPLTANLPATPPEPTPTAGAAPEIAPEAAQGGQATAQTPAHGISPAPAVPGAAPLPTNFPAAPLETTSAAPESGLEAAQDGQDAAHRPVHGISPAPDPLAAAPLPAVAPVTANFHVAPPEPAPTAGAAPEIALAAAQDGQNAAQMPAHGQAPMPASKAAPLPIVEPATANFPAAPPEPTPSAARPPEIAPEAAQDGQNAAQMPLRGHPASPAPTAAPLPIIEPVTANFPAVPVEPTPSAARPPEIAPEAAQDGQNAAQMPLRGHAPMTAAPEAAALPQVEPVKANFADAPTEPTRAADVNPEITLDAAQPAPEDNSPAPEAAPQPLIEPEAANFTVAADDEPTRAADVNPEIALDAAQPAPEDNSPAPDAAPQPLIEPEAANFTVAADDEPTRAADVNPEITPEASQGGQDTAQMPLRGPSPAPAAPEAAPLPHLEPIPAAPGATSSPMPEAAPADIEDPKTNDVLPPVSVPSVPQTLSPRQAAARPSVQPPAPLPASGLSLPPTSLAVTPPNEVTKK